MDQLSLLANWAAATLHVNDCGLWHAPWMLAAWKRLIAGSGWLTILDWLRGSHVARLRCHVDLWSLVVDGRFVVCRGLMVGVYVMRHSSLFIMDYIIIKYPV